MRLPIIFHISRKEIISTFRDRRAIISSIVMPLIIFPLMMLGFPLLITGLMSSEVENTTEVAIEGLEYLPEELRIVLQENKLELVAHDDPFQAVQDDDFTMGLRIGESFADNIKDNNAELTLISKASNLRSDISTTKIYSVIQAFNQEQASEQLQAVNLDTDILSAIDVQLEDATTLAEKKSGQFGWMIIYGLSLMTFMGGQMVALDTTAGEKERGTLESLFVAPVTRLEVVLGKFIAVFTFAFATAVMSVLGYVVGGLLAPMGDGISFNFDALAPFVISAIMLSMMLTALLLGIAMFARSIKEAQSYIAPISFLLMIPSLMLMAADFFDFGLIINVIPLVNMLWFMGDALKGEVDTISMLLTWGSTLLFTILLMYFAWRNFKREGVIFRN